jgi:hypothetical protein
MAVPPENGRYLVSWQGIADYLGVTVRAAQKWETERGLPVRRLPGKRSLVSANRVELDAWRNSQQPLATPAAPSKWRFRAILGSILLAAALLAGYWFVKTRSGSPASFRVEQNVLIVLDSRGREVWRANFPETLSSAEYETGRNGGRIRFWTGDLDGDGHPEVLFAAVPAISEHSTLLVCYSDRGVEEWRFKPGRSVSSVKEPFADVYYVQDFQVAPLGKNGAPMVVVSSSQTPDYPNQVALLSGTGKLMGEYWHSGYLGWMAVSGREIYLGGISNAYKAATLVVLDADHVSGASVEEKADYQLQGFPAAHEVARILFPRSCINRKFEQYNAVTSLSVNADSVTVGVSERRPPTIAQVLYRFDPDLQLRGFELHDGFRSLHADLRASHVLDHDLTPAEEAAFKAVRTVRSEE